MVKASPTVWGIDAGKTGGANPLFPNSNAVTFGWVDVGNLAELTTDSLQ